MFNRFEIILLLIRLCKQRKTSIIWASAWQNEQNDMCVQRRLRSAWTSAQSGWSVFAIRMKTHWVLSYMYPLSTQRRFWPVADAQADLSLHWAHRSVCWFCHAKAHIIIITSSIMDIMVLIHKIGESLRNTFVHFLWSLADIKFSPWFQ